MTLQETAIILNKYRLAFPNFELTPNVIKLWRELFDMESPDDFDRAMKAAVTEPGRAFFPTPGEFSTYLRTLKKSGQELLTAGEAWEMAVGIACTPHSELFGPPRVLAAIRQIGEHRIRYADFESIGFVQRDFMRCYDDLSEKDEKLESIRIGTGEAKKTLGQIAKQISHKELE